MVANAMPWTNGRQGTAAALNASGFSTTIRLVRGPFLLERAAIAALLLLVGGAATSAVEPPALLDQLGRTDSLAAHRGQIVVVLAADLRALRGLRAWELALRDRLGSLAEKIQFLRVADAPPDRGITRERVLDKLEGRVPDDVRILIDVEGTWREAYDLVTRQPNVLVFDRDGRLLHTLRGQCEPGAVERVALRILELKDDQAAH
jgi:hypothetical protein